MSNFFDGFDLEKINRNPEGNKITWLAKSKDSNQKIIIKKISTIKKNDILSGVENYKKKINLLKIKNYPFVLKHLGIFATNNSIYILREYKQNVFPLSKIKTINLEYIKIIAIRILSALVELQESDTPIFHQNIKPENIFIDKKTNIYLTDFGFSEIMTYSLEDFSSQKIVKELVGFTAPEQFIKPRKSTDLYGVGATLICLITNTKSKNLYKLTDRKNQYRINFKSVIFGVKPQFIEWLEKMISPELRNRFKDAKEALDALKPISLTTYPVVKLSEKKFVIHADPLQPQSTVIIKISNSIKKTILSGNWLVKYNFKDFPDSTTKKHSWISFNPDHFTHNNVECKIVVNTNKLMADSIYERDLILRTNCFVTDYKIPLYVITPPLSLQVIKPPYLNLLGLFFSSFLVTSLATFIGTLGTNFIGIIFSLMAWLFIAGVISFTFRDVSFNDIWTTTRYIAAGFVSLFIWSISLAIIIVFLKQFGTGSIFLLAIAQFLIISLSILIGFLAFRTVNEFEKRGFSNKLAISSILSTIMLSIFVGMFTISGFTQLLIPLIVNFLLLVSILIFPLWQEFQLMKQHKELEEKNLLIKP